MTYTDQIKQHQEREQAAQLAQQNADAWRQILVEHPDVVDGQGNFDPTLEFCEGVISSEKFRVLLRDKPAGFDLAFGDDRPKLIAKIMDVVDPKGIRHSESLNSKMVRRAAVNDQDRAIEDRRLAHIKYERNLQYLNRVQLLDELASKGINVELRSKSAVEVKQRLEAMRPKVEPPRADGRPVLPQFLILPGRSIANEMTPEFIRSLPREDYRLYKWLYDRFGGKQLTERSQG